VSPSVNSDLEKSSSKKGQKAGYSLPITRKSNRNIQDCNVNSCDNREGACRNYSEYGFQERAGKYLRFGEGIGLDAGDCKTEGK